MARRSVRRAAGVGFAIALGLGWGSAVARLSARAKAAGRLSDVRAGAVVAADGAVAASPRTWAAAGLTAALAAADGRSSGDSTIAVMNDVATYTGPLGVMPSRLATAFSPSRYCATVGVKT